MPRSATARISGVPFFASNLSIGSARRSPTRATPHAAATATASAGMASSSAFFGTSSDWNFGSIAGSRSAPHGDHRAHAKRKLRLTGREREQRGRRVFVLHVTEHVDRDALLRGVAVRERVEQRLHGARADLRELRACVVGVFAFAVTNALHEPEREVFP